VCPLRRHPLHLRPSADPPGPRPFLAAFDLADLFFRFTLNSFAEMAFGQDLGSLSTETDEQIPFALAFDEAQVISNGRFTNPLWPVLEFFNGKRARMAKLVKVMDDFAYGVIDEREREGLGNFTGADKKEAADKDLLSLYLALRDENGEPLTRKMLRCALFAPRAVLSFAAGADSGALARSDAIFNLIIAGRCLTFPFLSDWRALLTPSHPSPQRHDGASPLVDLLPPLARSQARRLAPQRGRLARLGRL